MTNFPALKKKVNIQMYVCVLLIKCNTKLSTFGYIKILYYATQFKIYFPERLKNGGVKSYIAIQSLK